MQEKYESGKTVAILTESSDVIGLGHLRRCIVLGNRFKDMGKRVVFFSNNCSREIVVKNLMVFKNIEEYVPGTFKYVVRDFKSGSKYADVKTEIENGSRVLLLDDKGRARTIADLVCDVFMTPKDAKNLPHGSGTIYLYGLEYSIINTVETVEFDKNTAASEYDVDFLIYFNLWDTLDITYKFVKALDDAGYRGKSIVVLAKENKKYKNIENILKSWSGSCLINYTPDMMRYMSKAKIVVTKIGVTVLESFYLGKPCITIEPTLAHLDLHNNLSENYSDWPAIILGMYNKIEYEKAAIYSLDLLEDSNFLKRGSVRAKELVDGKGAERVAKYLIGYC